MRKPKDMFILTMIMDIILLSILCSQRLNLVDKYNIYIIFLVHMLLYYAIIKKNDYIIDHLHILLMIYLYIVSLFITNPYFLFLIISTILTMMTYWFVDKKCPFSSFDNTPIMKYITKEYSYTLNRIPLVVIAILLFKIYYYYKK